MTSGSSKPNALRIVDRLELAGLDRRRLDVRGPNDQLGGVGLRRQQRLRQTRPRRRRCDGSASAAASAPRSPAAGPSRRSGCRSSAGRPGWCPRPSCRSPGSRPASVAPVTRITPASEQEHGQDVGAERRDQVRGDPELGLAERCRRGPRTPPGARTRAPAARRARARACPRRAPASAPPPGRAMPVRSGRAGGRSSRIRISAPAATSDAGNRVAERAEHEPERAHRTIAERAAGPVRVRHAAEEDADRDQRQRDDVDVMGLERDRAARTPASSERRARAAATRLARLGWRRLRWRRASPNCASTASAPAPALAEPR